MTLTLSSPDQHGGAGPIGVGVGDDPEVVPSPITRKKTTEETEEKVVVTTSDDSEASSLRKGEDILALQDLDPALNAKMHLVNNVSE